MVRFSCSDVLQLLSGEVFPAVLPKLVKLLWGPFFIMISVRKLYKGFQFSRMTFEDSDCCGLSVTIAK